MRSFYEFRFLPLAMFQMNIGIEPESGHIHGELDAIGNIFRLRSTEKAIRSCLTVKPRLSASSDVVKRQFSFATLTLQCHMICVSVLMS